ncbi:MAG: SIR2 family protein [Nitrososphaeraceae archaeon]
MSIFSTNYDIVIERLCESYGKTYTDGFTKGWNSESFRDDVDIRLYKLHGSVTWSRSEKGRYSKNEIVLNQTSNSHTNIITGDLEIPLILYPGKKLDYSEPVFDTLMELKNSLNIAKYVFVIGYRFRDVHLRELFQNAAHHNREFVIILISPSAYSICKNKLEYLIDNKFSNESHERRSSLYSRVICLPYKVEKIMPYLKKEILDNLMVGDMTFKKNKEQKQRGEEVNWIQCLSYYAECEYIQRIDQIVNGLEWFDLEKKDWKATFELSFKTLISLAQSRNTELITKWNELFRRTTDAYSPTSLIFIPMVTPQEIRFEFKKNRYTCSIPHPDSLIEGLNNVISYLDKKEMYTGKSVILTDLKLSIMHLRAYFQFWINQKVKYSKYYEMRKSHKTGIDQLKYLVSQFLNENTEAKQEEVASRILCIEAFELRKIMDSLDKCINSYETLAI